MNRPHLIGLVGKAGAGKDTLAAALAPLGYARVAFADALKASAYEADPLVAVPDKYAPHCRLSALVDAAGWDAAKKHADVRRFLQRHGIAMRQQIPGCWVTIAARRIDKLITSGRHVVVTDVRFDDEAAMIAQAGGRIVLVDRPGNPHKLGSNAGHVSEQLADRIVPDLTVVNDTEGDATSLTGLAIDLHADLCDRSA